MMPSASDLEALYRLYNRRSFVPPDPLETLYDYPSGSDREIVGLIAACLAYGRVAQILRNLRLILSRLGPSPAHFLRTAPIARIRCVVEGFKHRFTDETDLLHFLLSIRQLLSTHGSLEKSFLACVHPNDRTTFPPLRRWATMLAPDGSSLVPHYGGGSAFKRLNLFLRWMIRKDDVDPGCWTCIPPSMLIVPLDTHMCHIARAWGLTRRCSADAIMAMEITDSFRRIRPDDPVRYDFVLTRFGINPDISRRTATKWI